MAAKKSQRRRRTVAVKRGAQLIISETAADAWWKWLGRVCIVLIPVFGGLWYVFGWYNGVETLKLKFGELTNKVEAMWVGQTEILSQMKKIEAATNNNKK